MTKVTRRRILAAGATGIATTSLTLPEWLARRAEAQPLRTRYDVGSAEGIENLKIYARAVARMMDPAQYPQGNPRSWTFQWYTHWTKGTQQNNDSKVAEIARIYGSGSSPDKALAEAMWNTCQAHAADNTQEENFLPWHRMYVLYLEEIIRAVAGADEFTLPYWSYDQAGNRMIPSQFRMPGDSTFGSLYREDRKLGVNQGVPINLLPGAAPMNNDSLSQPYYLPTSAVQNGFNQTLDAGLHGAVHVNVGTRTNMGFVPTAAGDPIFWLHHCEIDRFWASWNANGGTNPPAEWQDWGNRSWTFVDGEGQKVTAAISQVIGGTVPLGYTYDTTISGPSLKPSTAPAPKLMAEAAPMAGMTAGAMPHDMALKLGNKPASITLKGALPAATFKSTVSKLAASRRQPSQKVYLAVNVLTTDEQPGVAYNIYIELPPDASPSVAQSYFVGSVTFFHAHPPMSEHAGHSMGYVFDITELAANLAQDGQLKPDPTVTVAPAGEPAADAAPAIGSFQFILG